MDIQMRERKLNKDSLGGMTENFLELSMGHNRISSILGELGCRFDPLAQHSGLRILQLQLRPKLQLGSDPWPRNSIGRIFFGLFAFSRAAPKAYGGFQARGRASSRGEEFRMCGGGGDM